MQPDMSRIARAAQALRELTLADLDLLPVEAMSAVVNASHELNAIPAHDWTVEVHHEVRDLVRVGKKINAIKRQRELTNMGLAEAKDFVERIAL